MRRAELAESLKNLLPKELKLLSQRGTTQTSPSDGDQLFLLPCEEEDEKPWCFSEIEIFPLFCPESNLVSTVRPVLAKEETLLLLMAEVSSIFCLA